MPTPRGSITENARPLIDSTAGSGPRGGNQYWKLPACTQGVYYVATGFWPVFEANSFQVVTGPKVDVWLVQIFGATLGVLGLVLLGAIRRQAPSRDLVRMAIGVGLVLTLGDIVFVAIGRISPVYLLDAAAHVVLLIAWIVCVRL